MKATVFCRPTDKGVHTFYLNANGTEYYLFHQNYRKGVSEYYRNGVSINEAINFGRSKKDDALMRTMQKLPMYLKYAEKEYGIQVLNQTIKKNKKYGNYHAAA